MYNGIFIYEIKLPDDTEFSKKFNAVGDWYSRAKELDTAEAWEDFMSAKNCLEQGLPVPQINNQ